MAENRRKKADMSSASFEERVFAAVRQIPRGCVATYGDIAYLVGAPRAARAVGNALHRNPDGDLTPCYRVVNASGRLSPAYVFGGEGKQKALLEADGIVVKNGCVDLERYRML